MSEKVEGVVNLHSGKSFPKLNPEVLKLIKWLAVCDCSGQADPLDVIELINETWEVVLSKADEDQVDILITDYRRQ